MSVGRSEHKVFLYKNDYNTMCTEVYRHQHIETGGNLFGLWTTSGNAVVQVVVGPGKDCKRTDVSFSQDIEYMKHVGEFLNEKFMLCHIGEWHSYHHLTLNKPSDGDRRTVRNNYPQGMKKFLVIFANIEGTDRVVLSPYFFTDNGYTCLKAEFQVLDADSPFTSDLSHRTIARKLHIGSENQQSEPMDITPTNNYQPTSRDDSRRSANQRQSSSVNSSPAPADGENDRSSSSVTDYARAVETGSGVRAVSASNPYTPPQGETPPPDYPDADSSRQHNGRNPSLSQASRQETSRMSGPPSASQSQSPTTTKLSPPTRRNENEKQTRKEITLQNIFHWIRSNLHPQDIGMEGNPSGDIEMKFKHKNKSWLITFPKRFPEEPAKIFCCRYNQIPKSNDECQTAKPNSLNNYIDILLSIKRNCSFDCTDCKKMTVESVSRADSSPSLFLTEKGNAMLEELNDSSIADPGSFETQIKYDLTLQDDATLEVSFKHSSKLWIITLTSTFPVSLAKMHYKYMRYGGSHGLPNHSSTKKLDSASKILLAISQECRCEKCKDFVKNI